MARRSSDPPWSACGCVVVRGCWRYRWRCRDPFTPSTPDPFSTNNEVVRGDVQWWRRGAIVRETNRRSSDPPWSACGCGGVVMDPGDTVAVPGSVHALNPQPFHQKRGRSWRCPLVEKGQLFTPGLVVARFILAIGRRSMTAPPGIIRNGRDASQNRDCQSIDPGHARSGHPGARTLPTTFDRG